MTLKLCSHCLQAGHIALTCRFEEAVVIPLRDWLYYQRLVAQRKKSFEERRRKKFIYKNRIWRPVQQQYDDFVKIGEEKIRMGIAMREVLNPSRAENNTELGDANNSGFRNGGLVGFSNREDFSSDITNNSKVGVTVLKSVQASSKKDEVDLVVKVKEREVKRKSSGKTRVVKEEVSESELSDSTDISSGDSWKTGDVSSSDNEELMREVEKDRLRREEKEEMRRKKEAEKNVRKWRVFHEKNENEVWIDVEKLMGKRKAVVTRIVDYVMLELKRRGLSRSRVGVRRYVEDRLDGWREEIKKGVG